MSEIKQAAEDDVRWQNVPNASCGDCESTVADGDATCRWNVQLERRSETELLHYYTSACVCASTAQSVCLYVSLSAMSTSYVKAPTLTTEMPFGVRTPRGPSDYVLSGGPEPPITLCQSKSCQLLCGYMKNTH